MKSVNAQEAGASAVIIMNEGDAANRTQGGAVGRCATFRDPDGNRSVLQQNA